MEAVASVSKDAHNGEMLDRDSDSDRELNNVRCLGGDDCNWCVRGSCSREYGDRAGGFAICCLFIGYEKKGGMC